MAKKRKQATNYLARGIEEPRGGSLADRDVRIIVMTMNAAALSKIRPEIDAFPLRYGISIEIEVVSAKI